MKALLLKPEPNLLVVYSFENEVTFRKALREIKVLDNEKKIVYKGLWWEAGDDCASKVVMPKPTELEVIKSTLFKNYINNRFDMTTELGSFNSAMKELEFRDYIIIYNPVLPEVEEVKKLRKNRRFRR